MQDDVISYFLRLVAIDSESKNERAMVDVLKLDLEELGATVEEDNGHKHSDGNAGNLYAYIPGNIAKKPLLFCAHCDTVTPGNGIKAKIENGRIFTDGTTILGGDDKSGIAEIIIAIKRVIDSGIDHAPIEILFTISEEIGLIGAKCFNKSKIKADFGYAFDGQQVGELTIGAPSQNSFIITIYGKESHAGVEPEKGLNAIKIASEAIVAMPMGRIDFETTCNIGKIIGGSATNIVPNQVTIKGEARSHNKHKLAQVCADIRHAVERTVARYDNEIGKADFRFVMETEYDAFSIPEDAGVVKLAQSALRQLDIPFTTGKGGGGSDANILNTPQLQMIIVGTGMNRVHTVAEDIKVDQLHQGVEFVEEMIRQYSEA
ncbi:MAG: M20/M25/M40 family metallo-hydrolase [Candidatus Cloacimonetes bacterium]|nr:M20/M25/M40 family metallo-hydrolase [Candidatus Cloacimonadota bacterium]